MATLLRRGFLAGLILAAGGCSNFGDICSDYRSTRNCLGGIREAHEGIDFRGNAGTEVISATHGTIVRKTYNDCAGYGLNVKTDIVARHGDAEGPVYVAYWHMQPLEGLKPSQEVKPGDVIGRIIPLRNTRCYGSAEHVHYELRVLNKAENHIDPNAFWVDGPGNVTCFKPGVSVPAGKAVAPLRCTR